MTRTKKFRLATILLTVLSICLTIGPTVVYCAMSFVSANANTTSKVTLMSMLSIVAIVSLVCLLLNILKLANKFAPRCRMWLLLIGFYMCLDNFIGVVLVIAITQCVDELIVRPMIKHCIIKYSMNKEIDKRL